ncbi:MAG: hypothetical protein Q7R96_02745 [Nanoarchaeota archaeon]|nr:hypothetical protein [Nanoarchaeota archaeon]
MRQKRGQVTIYVILGIVILIIISMAIYITQKPTNEGVIKSTSLPAQFSQVEATIQGCLEQTAKEGINIVSTQGGYLTVEDPYPLSLVNRFSTTLATLPGGSPTAYWYYEQANNIPVTKAPTTIDLQQAIETYIDTHLATCLDYSTFEAQGYRFITANPVSTVSIGNNNVQVTLHYPITIIYKDVTTTLKKTTITIPTALGILYKTARNFFDVTSQQLYFENKTLDFITIYEQLPSSGVDFNCAPKTWTRTQVFKDFKKVLAKNLPYLKPVSNTHSFTDPFLINNAIATPKNIQIDIQYNENWPFQLEYVGNNDEILTGKPFTSNNKLTGVLTSIFCLNQYHFVYNIKYPLLVTVRQGDEYFQYAYQVVIDHNQPRTATILPKDYDITLNENSPLCQAGNQAMTIYTLTTNTAGNYQPIPGTTVTLQCADALCTLGTSNNKGELTLNAPACINGIIGGNKQGYQSGTELLATTEAGSIAVVLDKIYQKTITTLIASDGTERILQQGEQAFITLERTDKPGSIMIVQPGTQTTTLTAGIYYVRSYLLSNNPGGITIADRTVKACVDQPKKGALGILGITEKKCTDHTVKGTTLDQAISGGNDYSITITEEELTNNNHLTFIIPYFGTPRTYDALTKVNEQIKKSKALQPRWSNE